MTGAWCGPFTPDPDVPADFFGRRYCRNCGRFGETGDAHHAMPVVPEQVESRRRVGDVEPSGTG